MIGFVVFIIGIVAFMLFQAKKHKDKEYQAFLTREANREEREKVDEIKEELKMPKVKAGPVKVHNYADRNDPCPCGSGVKNKKCCKIYSKMEKRFYVRNDVLEDGSKDRNSDKTK